jgi:hypothetical protein
MHELAKVQRCLGISKHPRSRVMSRGARSTTPQRELAQVVTGARAVSCSGVGRRALREDQVSTELPLRSWPSRVVDGESKWCYIQVVLPRVVDNGVQVISTNSPAIHENRTGHVVKQHRFSPGGDPHCDCPEDGEVRPTVGGRLSRCLPDVANAEEKDCSTGTDEAAVRNGDEIQPRHESRDGDRIGGESGGARPGDERTAGSAGSSNGQSCKETKLGVCAGGLVEPALD